MVRANIHRLDLAKLGMIIERFENGKLIGEEEDDNTSS